MQLVGTAVALGSGTLGNTYHTLVALSTGALWASGANWDGQLGNSDTNDVNLPTRVCADVACATYFAVDVAGITAGHNVIARGRNWSTAIKDDGTLWVWGDDGGSGVFGNGSLDVQSNIPVQVNFTP
ncbi:MAG: hypothetical protein JRI23_09630 [Deltaproteobacteria bacterium]|jgi:alpha-tubulin suppressor-like RCC1 family protein|nr:hypothetical protein [Deltaproteobacteria bacterium]MBW2531915.1 hypothetical protein [Deltaproteobacteria bacterium]